MLHHFQKARIGAKKILAEVGSAFDKIFLLLAVADFSQAPDQQPIAVRADQTVPIRAPNDLDHIPTRPAEDGLEFLNDFAIPAHRTIKALQIAVDDKNQV